MSEIQARILNRFLRGLVSYIMAGIITYVSVNYVGLVRELIPNQTSQTLVLAVLGALILAVDKYRRDRKVS